jgi:hypothetical protein
MPDLPPQFGESFSRNSKPSFLTKLLCRVAFKPFPWPERPVATPAQSDALALGRYLANDKLLCFGCHSADFATNDDLHPERSTRYFGGGNAMPDLGGKIVYTANLTPDPETGIGGWTEQQSRRALKEGIRPDNRPLRLPRRHRPACLTTNKHRLIRNA